ncbi:hypothetical protein V6N12_035440 [Hibiscus sabdariffa]|uniref:Uncharacterized protein n=1 Tax=Hibiscus sabdariffa TaxID=183260 RepID=A0ABR2EMR4_9ROSI
MDFESGSYGHSGMFSICSLCWDAQEIILIQSRAMSFLFCLGRESRQMSVSRQMSFLLISRSFHSELLQYNSLHLGPAAFEFCQGRSVSHRLPEITNKLSTFTKSANHGVLLCTNIRFSSGNSSWSGGSSDKMGKRLRVVRFLCPPGKEFPRFCSQVYSGELSRGRDEIFEIQMANNTISLRSLLEKEKLNGINFLDWFRNLRIVLKQERKEYVVEEPVPNDPGANA